MSGRAPLPIVAIVGRPNVGKSTLFNRYAGSRRALVENVPGVTRDRIAEEIEVEGRSVLLVDTAGLDADAEAGLEQAVQEQARAAVAEADAILFVVDGRTGLLPEDEALARTLRRTSRPLTLLVNKVDLPQHEARASEFFRLGFERTRPISAEHGRGAWDAFEELVEALPEAPASDADAPEEGLIRVAIVGRPNVGKSSLANALLGQERVVVSDAPGTTRDAIDSRLETEAGPVVLIDTAGIRRPGRRTALAERASALMSIRAVERADVAVLVIDAAEGFTDQDARVAGLVRQRGRGVIVAANKWDRVATRDAADRERTRAEIERRLRFMPDAPVRRISAQTGRGVDRLLALAREILAASRRRIPTAELNRWLEETVARHEPAMAQRGARKRPVRFLYATQTGVQPPTFVLFCSAPADLQRSYVRFLENRLRERFELAGTPVRFFIRHRRDERSGSRPAS